MDGYTAARVIRQELQLQTPIIAMTAHALAGEREKCLSFGMNEYISKPVSEQNLYNLVMHFTPTQPGYTVSGTQATQGYSNFQYINLSYIKEVSNGNTAYEKEVTVEFIESIPAEMEKLEYFFITKNYIALQQTAHNLKTTVGIMGLLPALQQQIDTLEHNTETPALEKALVLVREICSAAVEEAAAYLAHLHGKAEIN
jgi:CheY-like chemotaxis protein